MVRRVPGRIYRQTVQRAEFVGRVTGPFRNALLIRVHRGWVMMVQVMVMVIVIHQTQYASQTRP
jgi:hypothetical protein